MTERQDMRPLSTEDLLPNDRTRTDEDTRFDRADETGTAEGQTYQAQHADADAERLAPQGDTDEAQQLDADVRADQYDEVPATADQYDTEPAAQRETARPTDDGDTSEPLFTDVDVDRFRVEWRELQSDFVDHPRDAVQHADELVAQVMQSLATTFAEHKRSLEGQWSAGEQVETEELRVALRRYRAFFDQLLTV
jgi:hypothetical protein